jgi:uncharacterized protein (TIGR00730 family)
MQRKTNETMGYKAKIAKICVYCGSGSGQERQYAESARHFGEILAREGIGLVYGGGSLGLMGEIARAVLREGGHVTGIIPGFLSGREQMLVDAQELIVTEDMHRRKQLMFAKSDAFVALAGGLGTLEEVVEQLTWSQLGRHRKPIVLVNVNNYWDPLLEMFDDMRAESFIRPGLEPRLTVVDSVDDILPAIRAEIEPKAPAEEAEEEARVTAKF